MFTQLRVIYIENKSTVTVLSCNLEHFDHCRCPTLMISNLMWSVVIFYLYLSFSVDYCYSPRYGGIVGIPARTSSSLVSLVKLLLTTASDYIALWKRVVCLILLVFGKHLKQSTLKKHGNRWLFEHVQNLFLQKCSLQLFFHHLVWSSSWCEPR